MADSVAAWGTSGVQRDSARSAELDLIFGTQFYRGNQESFSILKHYRPFCFNSTLSFLADYTRRGQKHPFDRQETHGASLDKFKLTANSWLATVRAATGSMAAIALVASAIQAHAENVLLKCNENNGRQTAYWDIDENRVIRNGQIDATVNKSSIAISRYAISFEEIAGTVKSIWKFDRTTGEYSVELYVNGILSGKPSVGSCEKDTRSNPKF